MLKLQKLQVYKIPGTYIKIKRGLSIDLWQETKGLKRCVNKMALLGAAITAK